MRWAATDEEVKGGYPGSALVQARTRGGDDGRYDRGAPDPVWRWLVQLGGDRGGWYYWHHLDNEEPATVHTEWQDLALGDYVKYWTRKGPQTRGRWQRWNRFLGRRGLRDLSGRQLDPTAAIRLHRRALGLPAQRGARRAQLGDRISRRMYLAELRQIGDIALLRCLPRKPAAAAS